jgi:hypothetical protein
MTDQKSRWAAAARGYRGRADKARAQAEAIVAGHEKYRGDVAFWTQPGRIIERDRMHARSLKAYELGQKAKRLDEKAANLERLATTNAGDAAARHQAERDAVTATVRVGDLVDSVYGVREVVKVNRVTLGLSSPFGGLTIDKSLCRKVPA